MTKFLLLLVILATACAAPQSRNNPQPGNNPHLGNKPCVIGASKTESTQKKQIVTIKESPPIAPVDTDPTNHYYFSAPLDPVNNGPQEYREVPDEVRYNIIFVRVPPFVPKVQEEIELQPKTDEKTTVYVLVKRPEDPEIIELPKLKEPEDEKPEVIVVKYNEDKDIQAQIEGIQQSKIFGDLGIVRTSQVSETQVNRDLQQLKKGDITQLKLVDDTRTPSNQQLNKRFYSKIESSSAAEDYRGGDGEETNPSSIFNSNSSNKGSSVNDEDDYGEDDESVPSPVTQRPARNNQNQETEADKQSKLYVESYFDANNLKFDKKNQ